MSGGGFIFSSSFVRVYRNANRAEVRKIFRLMNVLRKLVFIFLICLLVKIVFSQQQYYIYIQSDNQQEFYVRTGSQTFNSSGNGYLVIPGFEKNTYEIIIGFPGKKEPEWRFNCTISETDLGFVLKTKGKDGVELLSLKQKEGLKGTVVERREIKESNVVSPSGMISNDRFSSMLADVVNDPTIRQQLVIIEKERGPAGVVNDDSAKALHASVSPAQTAINKEEDKVARVSPPATGIPVEAKSDTATAVAEKAVPFVVREIEKTDTVQTEKSFKAGAEEMSGSAVVTSAEKKYEPFVVKEIGKNDIPRNTSPEKAGIENSTDNNKEVKYLPFVIKPVDKKNNNENRTAKSETGEKAAAEIVPVETDVPLVVKKEDKALSVEKEKSGRSGSGEKDKDSARLSPKEKQSPAEKKSVLSSVKKILERKSRDGTDLIYVDENTEGTKDTIRIFIPVVQ